MCKNGPFTTVDGILFVLAKKIKIQNVKIQRCKKTKCKNTKWRLQLWLGNCLCFTIQNIELKLQNAKSQNPSTNADELYTHYKNWIQCIRRRAERREKGGQWEEKQRYEKRLARETLVGCCQPNSNVSPPLALLTDYINTET